VVDRIDELPVVTFTASTPPDLNPPVETYLSTMARGLAEAHGWGFAEIADYLLARPGVGDAWAEASLRSLVAA
jgi:hypothetical protein